jgi:hypothetical protein
VSLFSLSLILAKIHRDEWPNSDESRRAKARTKLQKMAEGDFVRIEASETFRDFVSTVRVEGHTNISDAANLKLHDALYNFFIAFNDGTQEAFLKYRTPVAAKPNPKRLDLIRRAMTGQISTRSGRTWTTNLNLAPPSEKMSEPLDSVPSGPAELLKLHFDRTTQYGQYRDWWQYLSSQKTHVKIYKTNAIPRSLERQIIDAKDRKAPLPTPNETVGLISYSSFPLYLFDNSPESILRNGGELVYVYTSWIVKSRPPDLIAPVFASFYWDEKNSAWLPWELLSGNSYSGTALIPIF